MNNKDLENLEKEVLQQLTDDHQFAKAKVATIVGSVAVYVLCLFSLMTALLLGA